jgi:hypothetical protein
LAGGQEGERPRELTDEPTSELGKREQEAWQRLLGTRIEVKPLPDSVTPEVRRNLERLGFNLLCYVPRLELGTVDNIRSRGVEKYLKNLQRVYPNWKHFESLSDREREDHSVPRNLEQWFWERVREGDIDFPVLPGQWMAVEKLEKPAYGRKYSITPFAERLGFRDDRFNVSWNDAKHAIDLQKHRGIPSEIGLTSGADLRFLEVLEWNLIANREGWGKTDTYEWTNTKYRESGYSYRLLGGDSSRGGAAFVSFDRPHNSNVEIGFRAAVVMGS